MTVGKFDEALFHEFRAATGVRRRLLLDRLVRENEPLVKTIVSQKLGTAEGKPGRRFGKRMAAAETVDWEDAMQAGRIALVKALEKLDLSKGRLSGFLAWQVLYQLQCVIAVEQPMKPERGHEAEVAASVDRFVEQRDLEEAIHAQGAVLEDEPEDDDAPLPTGDPANDTRGDEPYASSVAAFLETQCVFSAPARTPMVTVIAAYERLSLAIRRPSAPRRLVAALKGRGVRIGRVRATWSPWPVRGAFGMRLQTSALGAR